MGSLDAALQGSQYAEQYAIVSVTAEVRERGWGWGWGGRSPHPLHMAVVYGGFINVGEKEPCAPGPQDGVYDDGYDDGSAI
jgi:hypothetical protein